MESNKFVKFGLFGYWNHNYKNSYQYSQNQISSTISNKHQILESWDVPVNFDQTENSAKFDQLNVTESNEFCTECGTRQLFTSTICINCGSSQKQ